MVVGPQVLILLLAPAFSFIDADFVVCPYIDQVGGRVNDRVPYLSHLRPVPFAKGGVKFALACVGVASAEYLFPCSPDCGGRPILAWESIYWGPWVVLSVDCPFTDCFSIAGADIRKSRDAKV